MSLAIKYQCLNWTFLFLLRILYEATVHRKLCHHSVTLSLLKLASVVTLIHSSVKLERFNSSSAIPDNAVPQGSILGPLRFISLCVCVINWWVRGKYYCCCVNQKLYKMRSNFRKIAVYRQVGVRKEEKHSWRDWDFGSRVCSYLNLYHSG